MRARLAPMRTHDRDRALDLREAIHHTGYYPDVVADGVAGAVAGEEVVSFYVHHEPTFDRDEIRRHLTVVVLTPSRLVVAHTDEHAADDLIAEPYTSTSTEAIALSTVKSVVVTRMVTNPTSGSAPAGRGRGHHRLGRRQPDRPRAGRLPGPRVRGRPRLHRRAGLRRLLASASRPPPTAPTRSRGCWPSPTPCRRAPRAREPDRRAGLRRAGLREPFAGRRRARGGCGHRGQAPARRAAPEVWCCRKPRRTSCSWSTASGRGCWSGTPRRRRTSPRCSVARRPAPPASRRRPRPA